MVSGVYLQVVSPKQNRVRNRERSSTDPKNIGRAAAEHKPKSNSSQRCSFFGNDLAGDFPNKIEPAPSKPEQDRVKNRLARWISFRAARMNVCDVVAIFASYWCYF